MTPIETKYITEHIHRFTPYIPFNNITVHEDIANKQKQLQRWKKSKSHWGPRLWWYIHYTAKHYIEHHSLYSDKHIEDMKIWVREIYRLIPCIRCKAHYNKYLHKNYDPCSINDPYYLFNMFVDLHNSVNKTSFSYYDIYSLWGIELL